MNRAIFGCVLAATFGVWVPAAQCGDGYKEISLEDLHLDIRKMHYAKVIVRGKYNQLSDHTWLTDPDESSNKAFYTVDLNIRKLPRDRQKALLECDDCIITVKGVVDLVDDDPGIVVEAVSTRQ